MKDEFGIDTVDELYASLASLIDSIEAAQPNEMIGAVVDKRLISNGLRACQNYLKEKRKGELARKKFGDDH